MPSGLYLVTLLNEDPIPVKAGDRRAEATCIRANKLNCKLGKARDFARRQRDYERTFGAQYVIFLPYAVIEDLETMDHAERMVLQQVHEFRVRGRTGHLNEWLVGIEPQQALRLAVAALNESNFEYVLWNVIE